VEFTVVDQTTGFANYEQREDGPRPVSTMSQQAQRTTGACDGTSHCEDEEYDGPTLGLLTTAR
jgi:hypothetical protein